MLETTTDSIVARWPGRSRAYSMPIHLTGWMSGHERSRCTLPQRASRKNEVCIRRIPSSDCCDLRLLGYAKSRKSSIPFKRKPESSKLRQIGATPRLAAPFFYCHYSLRFHWLKLCATGRKRMKQRQSHL